MKENGMELTSTTALAKKNQNFLNSLGNSFIGSKLTCDEIWEIMTQIVCGIEFIHSHNAVHRDLKLPNGKQVSSGTI